MAKKTKRNLWIIGGIVVGVIVLIIIFSNIDRTPKAYCGDGTCNPNENKCSCSSDCGSCYGERDCNYYTCNI